MKKLIGMIIVAVCFLAVSTMDYNERVAVTTFNQSLVDQGIYPSEVME